MSHKITDLEDEKIESLEKAVQNKLSSDYRIRCFVPEYRSNIFGLHVFLSDGSLYDVKISPKKFAQLDVKSASSKIVSAILNKNFKDEKFGPGTILVNL